jgi:Protein of unknown function (DUF3551)
MMREFLNTVTMPAAALAAAIVLGAMSAPQANAAEFCRRDVTGHMTGCGFDSMEQCQAASAGVGGECFRDPYRTDNSNALAYQPKSHRARHGSPAAGTAPNTTQ